MENSAIQQRSTRGAAILGMLVAFLGGYVLGAMRGGGQAFEPQINEAAKAERKAVAIGHSPTLGPTDAPVTVVEFSDLQCPVCARTLATRKHIMAEYGQRVRWVFKHFPLTGIHPQAMGAAQATMAADAQGLFWEYSHQLFKNQKKLGPDDLKAHAKQVGLDLNRFAREVEGNQYASVVQADMTLGQKVGVHGTPTYFVNGRQMVGAMRYDKFESIIRQELAHAQGLLRKGIRGEDIYRELTKSDVVDPVDTADTADTDTADTADTDTADSPDTDTADTADTDTAAKAAKAAAAARRNSQPPAASGTPPAAQQADQR